MRLDVDDCDFSVLCFQFDLVCNDEWKQPFSTTVYFLGVLIGTFFAGYIADRYSTLKADSKRITGKTEFLCRHSQYTVQLMNERCCTCTALNTHEAKTFFRMIIGFVTIIYLTPLQSGFSHYVIIPSGLIDSVI